MAPKTTFPPDLPAIPPFSFHYGGSASPDFLAGWQFQAGDQQYAWTDSHTMLRVTAEIRRFADFQALDWVLEFENLGQADTPVLEDVLPLDFSLPIPDREKVILHHANGSLCRKDDFLPLRSELAPRAGQELKPVGGRSSSGAFPFMNLQGNGGGLVAAIGWSGQWRARFERQEQRLKVSAGMEHTRLSLHPGEKIRTPRILLLPWQGEDVETGQNLLRRLLLAYYLPRIDSKLVMPPSAQCLQAYFYLTGQAGEAYELKALPRAAGLGVEVYWIDACWYGGQGEWWQEVGSWRVNRQRFPRGLKPVSQAAHAHGMKFLVWFEPERCRKEADLAREHPEFLLRCAQDPDNLLYNLGDEQARAYLSRLISDLILENGIDIYRQDFNFDPLPYWQAADPPDRVGMTEIRHVEGLYALWDELRKRHPGLWIDNCSSGGRRIDLETLSRALPLWPSDFLDTIGLAYGPELDTGGQCINAGLACWVPLLGGGAWNFSPYSLRAQMIGGFNFSMSVAREGFPTPGAPEITGPLDVMAKAKTLLDDDFPVDLAKAGIAEWKSIRDYFLGNFHLLLPLTVSDHDWAGWQFHREDLNAGIALLFRRHISPFPEMEINLREIEPQAQYEVSLSADYDPSMAMRLQGKDLACLPIRILHKPGSVLVRYRRVEGQP